MANYKIEEIEGIGSVLGKQLRDAGINNTDKLLENSKTLRYTLKLILILNILNIDSEGEKSLAFIN